MTDNVISCISRDWGIATKLMILITDSAFIEQRRIKLTSRSIPELPLPDNSQITIQ